MTAIPSRIEELRARVAEKGPWFTVPSDATPARCRSCGSMVYFVTTATGKMMPVDVLVPGGAVPRREHVCNGVHEAREGRGVSHFATCPSANQWRKERAP